jgi:hypothetical protein
MNSFISIAGVLAEAIELVQVNRTDNISLQNASIVSNNIVTTIQAMAQGSIIGALPSIEAPFVLTAPSLKVVSQRKWKLDLLMNNMSVSADATNSTQNYTAVERSNIWFSVNRTFDRVILPAAFVSNSMRNSSSAILDTVFFSSRVNVYSYLDPLESTVSASIVSMSLYDVNETTRKSIREIHVENLTSPIFIGISHSPIPPNFEPVCQFFNTSASQLSPHGCQFYAKLKDNYTICACNHLTDFTLTLVYVPPRSLSQSDLFNFFNWKSMCINDSK